jgi:hypothetical protein
MRTLTLSDFENITLDANGNGTVQIGPGITGVAWIITQMATFTTSVENNPVFNTYLGDPIPQNFIGGTMSGNNDCNTGINILLNNGQYITGQWVGGDPGATATFTVNGTQTVP